MIIDEINRAEVSKVLGELFFSIDPGYRGLKGIIDTQYSNMLDESDVFYNGFYVPENVYIIGTMNDIDRSVESIDFAMRRRFAWIEVNSNVSDAILDGVGEFKEDCQRKMKKLNDHIETITGLSSSYHIGPAYFLKILYYKGDFEKLWSNHLECVLREYLRGLPDSANLLAKLKETYNEVGKPVFENN